MALTGGSGLIGTRLRQALTRRGDRVVSFVRDHARAGPGDRFWDPASGHVDALDVEGLDAIVHLAGAPIASGRWTAARKRTILESRLRSTRLLCDALATAHEPPWIDARSRSTPQPRM